MGDLLKILAADMKEEIKKDYRTGDVHADPSAWGSSGTGRDMINLVGYRVHLEIITSPSFHMAWIEIYITV